MNYLDIELDSGREARVFAPTVGSLNDALAVPARHDTERRTIITLRHSRIKTLDGNWRELNDTEIKNLDGGLSANDFDALEAAYGQLTLPRRAEERQQTLALLLIQSITQDSNPVLDKKGIIAALSPLLPLGDASPFTGATPVAASS